MLDRYKIQPRSVQITRARIRSEPPELWDPAPGPCSPDLDSGPTDRFEREGALSLDPEREGDPTPGLDLQNPETNRLP